MQYTRYSPVTKDILDMIEIGDYVKCNNWKCPYVVRCVSENYFVMTQKMFGKEYYSICEKKPAGYGRNFYQKNQFRISTDFWIFGYINGYHFDNPEWCKEYLNSLEAGTTELSERNAIGLTEISFKKGK